MKEILIMAGTVLSVSISAQCALDSVPQLSKEEVLELSGMSDSMFNSLVAYWPFNESSDEIVYDYSINRLNGTNHSAKITSSLNEGNALKFDGIDAVVNIHDKMDQVPAVLSSLNSGTIALWFKYDGIHNGTEIPASLPIIYFGQSSDSTMANDLEIYIGHDHLAERRKIFFTIHYAGRVQLCFNHKVNLIQGQWYHYAVAIDSLDHRGYINGEEFEKSYNARTTINHHAFFSTVPDEKLDVFSIGYGRFSGRSFSHFNGAIDEIMIFDRALHGDEIKQIYKNNIIEEE